MPYIVNGGFRLKPIFFVCITHKLQTIMMPSSVRACCCSELDITQIFIYQFDFYILVVLRKSIRIYICPQVSVAACVSAINSALEDNRDTMDCFLVFQEIKFLPMISIYFQFDFF